MNVHNCYHELLDTAAQNRGLDELYRRKDSYLYYQTASLNVSPSSPSRRALRGKTRCGFAVDEMGHFGESDKLVTISGAEVWRALTRSLSTVRPAIHRLRREGRIHIPPAIAVAISSPWSLTDPITTMYNKAIKTPNSSVYAVKLPTWEANPDIPREALQEEFDADEVSARRDYGCEPPFSANAFIPQLQAFKPSVCSAILPFATQRTRYERVRGSVSITTVDLRWRKTDKTTPRILALDAGRAKNAFAASVAHIDENGNLAYDLFVEIQPRPKINVGFDHARENVLKPIIENMNVRVMVSDRWQNYATSDWMARTMNVDTYEKTLKYGDFVSWRDDLTRGALVIPRTEIPPRELRNATGPEIYWLEDKPVAQLLRQSLLVVDVPGKTVEKPTEGNNDVFWTAVLAHAASMDPVIREVLKPTAASSRVAGAIAVSATASGARATIANPVPSQPRASRRVGVVAGSVRRVG